MLNYKNRDIPNQVNQITAGSIWQGRGLKIRVLRVSLGVIWIERIDISSKVPNTYRIHPWRVESIKGLKKVSN